MTSEQAAYVAGLLEGEGCFDFNASNTKYPRIRIEMCDVDVIEHLQDMLDGVGRISYKSRAFRPEWNDSAILTINGEAAVRPILESIRPWLGARRGAKVDMLLASYASVNEVC